MSLHIMWNHGKYIGQLRRAGYQKWETVTRMCKTREGALVRAAEAAKGRQWKRIRVLHISDNPYYGPSLSFEGKK